MGVSVEYAKSGRSTCKGRGCGKKIERDELRIVEKVAFRGFRGRGRGRGRGGFMGDGSRFFHLDCFPGGLSKASIGGLAKLSKSDQRKVVSALCCSDETFNASPSLEEGTSIEFPSTGTSSNSKIPADANDPAEWDLPSVSEAETILKANRNLPDRTVNCLMPFQKQGVAFAITKCKGRVLIGDEMGLGKTVQAICVLLAYRDLWPALVVSPSSVKLNWADEIEKWAPALEPGSINIVQSRKHPGNLKAPITIVTYGMFAKASEALISVLKKQSFKVVVLDESHYIKSGKAVRTQLLTPFLSSAQKLVLLSGTPALARPVELWPQVSALRPDLFHPSKFNDFASTFCNPRYLPWGVDLTGSANLDQLHNLMKRFMVRRLKQNVLTQLPSKQRQIMRLDIAESSPEMKHVKNLMGKLKSCDLASLLGSFQESGGAGDVREAIKARNEQRKTLSELYTATGQAKVSAACEHILSILDSTDKLICFAHHLAVLDALETALTRKKVPLMRIDGRTPIKARHDNVKQFQDEAGGLKVALLGLTSAGQGITLTAASSVIFVECHWTPGILIQAEDRAHRIGQKDSVNVTYLMGKGTLDDIIWPMVCRKLDTVGKALDGEGRVKMRADRTKARARASGGYLSETSEEGEGEDEEEGYSLKNATPPRQKSFPTGDMRGWLAGKNFKASTPGSVKQNVQSGTGEAFTGTDHMSSPIVDLLSKSAAETSTCDLPASRGVPSGSGKEPIEIDNDSGTRVSLREKFDALISPPSSQEEHLTHGHTDTSQSSPNSKGPSPTKDLQTVEQQVHQAHTNNSPHLVPLADVLDLSETNDSIVQVSEPSIPKRLPDSVHTENAPFTPLKRPKVRSINIGRKHHTAPTRLGQSKRSRFFVSELSDDEIEDVDDNTTNATPVCSGSPVAGSGRKELHFRVSGNTGRVFLYDKSCKPLEINFHPDEVQGDVANADTLPEAIRRRHAQEIQVFLKQWSNLRSIERKELSGQFVQPPLLSVLQTLRSKHHISEENHKFERYQTPALNAEGGKCWECGEEVPEDLQAAGILQVCSSKCMSQYQAKMGGSLIRRQAFDLEQGVCQICKVDAQGWFERVRALTPPERHQALLNSPFSPHGKVLQNPTAGDFWQADHIFAVALGGGQCDMHNIRTLCTPCHVKETRKLRELLKARSRSEAAANTHDIRTFFSSPRE